jgi:putative tricarboxylic transport membrane protein
VSFDFLQELWLGIQRASEGTNLLACGAGVFLGTLVGVLPGVGPLAAIAMLLPLTFAMTPYAAIIMLAGIYYGAQYGGSTTAILLRMPGEESSIVTCLDGHALARKGRAGAALAVAALSSLFAGLTSTLVIAFFAPVLARLAQNFGSPEYFALMCFGILVAAILAQGSFAKAIAMALLGLLLSTVGSDVTTNELRYTFDFPLLYDGLDFIAVALGLFGVSEVIRNLEVRPSENFVPIKLGRLWPSRQEFKDARAPAVRGALILPGGGAILSSFASYALEKKISRSPSRFGQGAIEGLAGPEAANNAGAQISFIPLLTLGIPSHVVMALIVGALVVHGIAPGTAVIEKQPDLFWALVGSFLVGNLLLVLINLPLIGLWVSLLRVPYKYLYPAIVVFACIGVYSSGNSSDTILLLMAFTLLGYLISKIGCEAAPLLLAFILGGPIEENFRRSMIIGRGDMMIFLERPISAAIIGLTVVLLIALATPYIRSTRRKAFADS